MSASEKEQPVLRGGDSSNCCNECRWKVIQRLRDRWVPCEPCQQGHHDDCTGDCTSNCCALAYSEERVDELEKAARDVVEASDEWVTQRVEDPRGLSEAEGATVAALRDLRRDLDGVGT